MAQARGIATKIQIWDETTYGVTPASPAGEQLYYRTCNVAGSIARAQDETMSGQRGMPASIQTQRDVSGQIVTTLAPQSCIKLLKHLIGTPTITTGAGTTFVFDLSKPLPTSFGMEGDFGEVISTPGRYLVHKGCRISKGTFKFSPTGFIDATYEVRGATFDHAATATVNPTPTSFGHAGFSMAVATIKEGGSAIATITEASIEIDNDLDDSLFTIGGGGVRGDMPEGFCKISGSVTALFKDAALLQKGLNNTETSLEIELKNGSGDGTAGNESFKLAIPNLYFDYRSPEIPGPKGLKTTLNFSGHRPAAGGELAASITVKTVRATA